MTESEIHFDHFDLDHFDQMQLDRIRGDAEKKGFCAGVRK